MARFLIALLLLGSTRDRADLRLPLDTWYQVLQGTRQAGYVHETLRRASPPWRYEYGLDAAVELTIRGKVHAEDQLATAFLDETLTPVEATFDGHAGEAGSSYSVYTLRDERRIELRETAAWGLPAGEDLALLPSLTLYQLRQNETLSRPGRITLRALDPRGTEKAGVEVVLEAGEPLQRTYLGKEVPVIPVRFLKPFPAPVRETEWTLAYVDRFGRVLEATMAGGARLLIAEHRDEALKGIGLLHRHGRRDPFDKSLAMRNGALERARAARGEPELAAPMVTLDSLDSDLAGARKMIEETRTQKAAGDLEDARRGYLRALVQLKAIRELALRRRPSLLPEVESARDEAESAWDGAAQVEREGGRLFAQVPELLDRLDVDALERNQKDLQRLRDRIEVERRPERDRIAAWSAEMGSILVKGRTRLELARARLDVSGITLGETLAEELMDARLAPFGQMLVPPSVVTVVRPLALADVNGRLLRAGDLVEGTSIRVDKITARSVQFSLRDETRDVGLRR